MSLNPARLFFTLPAQADFDSYQIEIKELSSPSDKGVVIDTIRINPSLDYVEVNNITSEYSWFKLTILNREGERREAKNAILSEKTSLKITEIRKSVKDTNSTDPAFSDNELLNKMRLAAMRLNNIRNLSSIHDKFWPIVELLVRIDICNVLAYDYAKYLKLEIPGGSSLSRDELYQHYIDVANSLQRYYENIKKDSESELSSAGDGEVLDSVQISNLTRLSYETGFVEDSLEPVAFRPSRNRLVSDRILSDRLKNRI